MRLVPRCREHQVQMPQKEKHQRHRELQAAQGAWDPEGLPRGGRRRGVRPHGEGL